MATGAAGKPTDPTDGGGSQHDLAPLGSEEEFTEEEFTALLNELVAAERPRLFSLCEEYGDRENGWVHAWGLAFPHRVSVLNMDGQIRGTYQSPESALRRLSRRRKLRLLWCDSCPPEQDTESAKPAQ